MDYIPHFIERDEELAELVASEAYATGEGTHYDAKAGDFVHNTVLEQVILLGCVDNNKSRQLCHRVFLAAKELIYIDSGNGEYTGQVVCGVRRGGRTYYKPVGLVYPELMEETDLFPSELSCAEASVSAPQTIVATLMAATAVVNLIYNILVVGSCTTRQVTFSTKEHPAHHTSKEECRMKATVDAREFFRALEKAAKAVYRRAPVPAFEQVRVDVDGIRCRLTATNLEQHLAVELPAEGGAFSLLLCNTPQVLKASKFFDGPLSLDYDQEHGELELACGPRSSRITVSTVDAYPDFPEDEPQAVYHTNAQVLSKRFERVKYAAASPNFSRKSLTGVHFTGNLLAAMDGYRVAINTDCSMDVRKPVILPMEAMALLPLFGDAEVRLEVGEKWCMLRSPALSLATRMLDFDVINFNAFIPTNVKDAYDVNVKQFAGELKYLGALLPEKVITPIKFSDGVLTVSTSNGEHRTAICLSAPAGMEYGFVWKYMLDALGQFKDAETVTVKVSAPLAPIVLTNGGADLALVMPYNLRTNKNAA